jgi:uncharacterized coiled-coil protein SlyX
MESASGSSADLQEVNQGCVELGRQVEGLAELVLPLLRLATQELGRLETQREELRKTGAREAPQPVLPKLNERIEEQAQSIKRLERTSRGLKELITGLGALGEQVQSGLARRDEAWREQEAIVREEKRMWLQELNALREQVRSPGTSANPSPGQHDEMQRLHAENEGMPQLRAEKERLTNRVAELEKSLAAREQTLTAKEQTIEDLRRMIVLLTGDAASAAAPKTAPKAETKSLPPPPVNVVPLTPKAPARARTPDTMFGSSTMQLATSMLETLGAEIPPPPLPAPPVALEPKVPSMEIMLGPLDELESPPPSLPPPVPVVPPVPLIPAVPPVPSMPRASARPPPSAPAKTPAPLPGLAPKVAGRPGTLIISEDMFNEMLVEESTPGGSGRK